jgi:hypothetical protein
MTITNVKASTATLSWTKVNEPLDNYLITFIPAQGKSNPSPVPKTATTAGLEGLTPGTAYVIIIRSSLTDKVASLEAKKAHKTRK